MHAATNFRYVLLLAATAATGGLLFGFNIAIISDAGPFFTHHCGLNVLSLGVENDSVWLAENRDTTAQSLRK